MENCSSTNQVPRIRQQQTCTRHAWKRSSVAVHLSQAYTEQLRRDKEQREKKRAALESIMDVIESIMDVIESIMDVIESIMDIIESIMDVIESIMDIIESIMDVIESIMDVIESIIDVIRFLARQNISFRGHREGKDSDNRGNFLELIHYRKIQSSAARSAWKSPSKCLMAQS